MGTIEIENLERKYIQQGINSDDGLWISFSSHRRKEKNPKKKCRSV